MARKTVTLLAALFFLSTLTVTTARDVRAQAAAALENYDPGFDAAVADLSAQGGGDAANVDYECLADCFGKCSNGYNMKQCALDCYAGCNKSLGAVTDM